LADQVIPVRVAKVKLENLQVVLEYVGDIKAQDEAVVYPKVSGKIIKKVKEDGSVVAKGDAIVYIDRDEVGLKFEKAPVESPLAGVVGRVVVDIGSNVTTQTPVALVVNMDKVKIDLEIPEMYLPQVLLNQEAKITVDAYPQAEFIGKVIKISPVLDKGTRTAPIQIEIDNKDHRLRSGMFARVSLVLNEHKNIPVIMKESLIGREPDIHVYVVEDKKAVLKKIVLDVRQDERVGIKEGLKEGDLVVVLGQQRLHEGAQVMVEE
jgi:RND family efflux transporter MFP subunit